MSAVYSARHAIRDDRRLLVHLSIAATFCALGFLSAASSQDSLFALTSLNLAVPLTVAAGCGFLAMQFFSDPANAWSPIAWFLAVCALYYGIGPLIYVFGSADSIMYMDRYYFVDPFRLMRTNALNAICLGVAIGVSGIVSFIFSPRKIAPWTSPVSNLFYYQFAIVLFLAIGLPLKLFAVLPAALSQVDTAIPSWVQTLSQMSLMAITPCLLMARAGHRRYRLLAYAIIIFELAIAFAMFSKLEIFKVVLFVFINYYSINGGLLRLTAIAVAIFAFYFAFLSDFILFIRMEFTLGAERSFWSFLTGSSVFAMSGQQELADLLPGVQSWWTRLSNAAPQAFAMDSYDLNQDYNSLALALHAWIPRFIFPDKPMLTIGELFNTLVTGNPTSQSAPGVFAEGYWNAGWLGAILVAAYVGGLLAVLHQYCMRVIASEQVIYIPCVWLCVSISLQPDSWFAAQFVGPLASLVGLHVLLRLFVISGPHGNNRVRELRISRADQN